MTEANLSEASTVSTVPHGTTEAEKMVPQHKVNELYSEAMQRGRDKALRELAEQNRAQQAQQPAFDADHYRKIAQEEFAKGQKAIEEKLAKQQADAYAAQVYNNLDQKIKTVAASGKYPDYQETINSLGLEKMPGLVWHAANVDGGEHVLYDLGKNSSKLAMLNALPPHLVDGELRKLAASIRMNDEAEKTTNLPPDPLGQKAPSNKGVGKLPSEMTASEWAKHYKGRVKS